MPNPVPTTAGRPYSLDTIAACDMIPPTSETAALIREKTGAQLGAVIGHTRISPVSSSSSSSTVRITRATPSTTPREAATPVSCRPSPSPSCDPSHVCTASVVIPKSMIVNGSVMVSGGVPRAGGGAHARSFSMIAFRAATSGTQ